MNELANCRTVGSKKAITRVLNRNRLQGYRPRNSPLLQKRHLRPNWGLLRRLEACPLDRWDKARAGDGERRVRCTTQRTPPCLTATIILRGCFSRSGTRKLFKLEWIIKKEGFVKILSQQVNSVWVIALPSNPSTTQRNLVKNCRQKTKVNVTDWPAWNPDLNPIEGLWGEQEICARRPSNLEQLERFAKEEWFGIAQEMFVRLC